MSTTFKQEKMARGRGQLLQRYRQHQTFDHKARHIARVVGYRSDERYSGDLDKAYLIKQGMDFVQRWRTAAQKSVRAQADGAPTFPENSPLAATSYDVIVPGALFYAYFPLTVECSRCRQAYVLPSAPDPGEIIAPCPSCGADPHHQLQHVFVHQCGYMRPFEPPARCGHCGGQAFRLDQANRFRDFRWICNNKNCHAPQDISRPCPEPNCQYKDTPMMRGDVHTASAAYIGHGVKVVNPPKPEHREKSQRPNFVIATVGQWLQLCTDEQKRRIIEGNAEVEDPAIREMIEKLREFSPETAEEFERKHRPMDAGVLRHAIAERLQIDENDLETTLSQFSSQLDTYERTQNGRIYVRDLRAKADSSSRKALYDHYADVMRHAGFADNGVFLIPDFPVIELAVGYSRTSFVPGEADLRSYRGRIGRGQAEKTLFYAHPQQTEALVFGLDDARVMRWLEANGWAEQRAIESAGGLRMWLAQYLTQIGDITWASYDQIPRPEWAAGHAVTRLMHTMAHQFVRALSVDSGFMETSLNEHFFPYHLSFAIYPRASGEFVIGGLRTVLEQNLDEIIERAMDNDQCIYDPNCYIEQGADHGCLYLPETACTFWNRNQHLSRWDLFGGPRGRVGFWSI